MLITLVYSVLLTIVSFIIGKNYNSFMTLLIPFGIMLCSIVTHFSELELKKLMIFYSVLVVLLGLASIFYYGNGFNIAKVYAIPMKNQLGPIIGNALIILSYLIFENSKKAEEMIIRFIYLFMLILGFLTLIVIRNRSGIVGCAVVIFIMFLMNYKFKLTLCNLIILEIISIMFLVLQVNGFFDVLWEMIWDSMTLNFDVADLQSLSSGRTDVYVYSIKYISENSLGGNLLNFYGFSHGNVHNYILFTLVRYGLVLSLPLVLFYLYLIKSVFCNLSSKINNVSGVSIWLLSLSIIVSLFEYSYPYGPGVTQIIVWTMIGQFFRSHDEQKTVGDY